MSDDVPEACLYVRTPYIKRSLRWNKEEHGKVKIKLPIARPRAYCEHIAVMLYEWRAFQIIAQKLIQQFVHDDNKEKAKAPH